MNETNMRLQIERSQNFMGTAFPVWLYRRSLNLTDGRIHIVESITLKELDVGGMRPEPSFSLSADAATELMDQLWLAGIRPSARIPDGDVREAFAVTLKSKDEHIKDLRAIVFNRLGVEQGV